MDAPVRPVVSFAIRGPIARSDLPGLCDRVCVILRGTSGIVDCDVDGVEPDAVTVDALARLQLGAQRSRCRVRLRGASPNLLALVELMGLSEIFPA